MGINRLPSDYFKIKEIDLIKSKRDKVIVNAVSFGIMLVMIVSAVIRYGWQRIADTIMCSNMQEFHLFLARVAAVIMLCLLYLFLHEMTHALLMKLFCKKCKVRFGYRFLFGYCASSGYYEKSSYRIIALMPILVVGVILGVICFFAKPDWFWVVYFVQIINISGAAGDFYVLYLLSRLPDDILINDNGISMSVYAKG